MTCHLIWKSQHICFFLPCFFSKLTHFASLCSQKPHRCTFRCPNMWSPIDKSVAVIEVNCNSFCDLFVSEHIWFITKAEFVLLQPKYVSNIFFILNKKCKFYIWKEFMCCALRQLQMWTGPLRRN